MEIGYWVLTKHGWKLVDRETFDAFEGQKNISSKYRSPVWRLVVSMLLQYRRY